MGLLQNLFRGTIKLNGQGFNQTLFERFLRRDTNHQDIINKAYESNVDAYSVVKKIVDVFTEEEWIVERNVGGTWELVEDTSIHELLENPNMVKGYTMQDIDEQQATYLLNSGDSYMVGTELNGTLADIDILPSNHVEIKTSQDFFLPNLQYKFEIDKTKRTYDVDTLEHIRMFNPSYQNIQESYNGLSVFQVAANIVKVGNDRWEASASLFQNGGAFGLITDRSNRPMTAEEAQMTQAAFDRDTVGTHKFGSTKVTNKDLNYIPMGMSSTDLQLVENGVITLRAMCNVFGLDSSLFNDPANKTFNNRKEAEKAMYTNVIIPLSDKIAAKHTRFIAHNHFPDKNVRMRKDFSKVEALQIDKKVEADKDKVVVDGMDTVLRMPVSPDSKIEILKDVYDISDELAKAIVVDEVIIPNTQNNVSD